MLRLRRVQAGEYTTRDGVYTIVRDPTSGREHGGWGYTSWLTYDCDADEPLWNPPHETLGEARLALERHIATLRKGS